MSISIDEVKKVANLARLAVSEDKVSEYANSLSNILVLADQLEAVDTTGILPLANPHDALQRLREDVVTETNHRAEYQKIAPEVEDGLYLVPQVID
ncbi:Asp-tRNA(Asn)/Glu-tRNA(Gln) amidotransferase subunit GatC [Thiofilum flexile]|uniref:Asp-tRNA(Asn)/Glu-tRNA(Gln) amidotransferase subunit GatC n=1 Tax=Thiofilum flexile TaxID=125627 RepID=UPI00036D9F60|nr:Asp-tRNA(Asn)/Glu-tRNA(Gln) amidotransferase subunit GatC [Thiofilum flexile]